MPNANTTAILEADDGKYMKNFIMDFSTIWLFCRYLSLLFIYKGF